jgi:hypothetical protein
VHVILATDMALHNDYVGKFRDQAHRLQEHGTLDISDAAVCERERTLLFSAIIKCADIGNVVSGPTRKSCLWTMWVYNLF